eukprot:m.26625 g.26625  ORF g.26625 m.26625 type:complete len:1353 (+) comp15482_c0_seq1:117-4175(+)
MEDPLIPLRRAKGALFDEDSTGFAAKRLVWFPDTQGSTGFVRGSIKKEEGDKVIVEQDGNKQSHTLSQTDISKVNPPKFDQAENMADLPNLNEAAVLFNLQDRYASNLIHTYSGLFVVVVNPFRRLPIYSDAVLSSYKGQRRDDRPPHIFAVADQAYRDMLQESEDQAILCTGESGAGKTENTKKVIQYLAYIAASGKSKDRTVKKAAQVASSRRTTMGLMLQNSTDLERGELENQLLKANPILETFGNAATVRNDNSSRFGKFIRIHFNAPGFITGASIDTYLLEKSRVVTQSAGERTFHAAYQLLKGGEKALKDSLLLGGLRDYKFIASERYDLDEIDDEEEWLATNAAFKIYGMNADEIKDIWKVIAGVLTFGQLEFEGGRRESEQAVLVDDAVSQKVALLFGISASSLVKSLTKPKIKAGTEFVQKAQTKEQVDSAVKALAKSLYEKLFLWIVQRINASLDRTKGRGSKNFIGILDIAGFEIFENNSFEQMLINFTNEKLQQLFNKRMFIIEQKEYEAQGIQWTFIDFGLDLQPTIDLIEGRHGILPILDEQSIFPKATDKSLVDKYEQSIDSPCFVKKTLRMKGDFAIKHYAGQVHYDAHEWLVKNKDPLNDNVVGLFKESSFGFMKTLWNQAGPTISSARHRGAMRTVAGIYCQQLRELMDTLNTTTPNFVRCIKPNHEKRPGKIDTNLVLNQLRCGGVLEGIRIVRKGFPSRVLFQDFRHRYQLLTPGAIPPGFVDSAKAVEHMLEVLELSEHEYRVGHTKIFFRAGVLSRLEEERDAILSKMLIGLQAYCRGKLARLAFRFHVGDHQAVGIIQRNVRAFITLRKWPWWRLYCKIKPMLSELQKRQNQNALADEIKALREQLDAEIVARKQAEERVHELKKEADRLRDELEFERESVVELEAELESKERKLKEWEEEMELSDQKLDELVQQQSQLFREKKELYEEIEDLKDDALSANADQARIERLEKEKEDMHKSMTEVEDSLASKIKQLKQAEANVKTLEAKVEAMDEALASAESARNKSQNEVEDLLSQVEDLSRQVAHTNKQIKEHTSVVKLEKDKVAESQANLQKTTATLHKTETKVIMLEEEVADGEAKIAALEKQKKQLTKDLEDLSARDDLEAKVNALQSQLRSLEENLAERTEECDELSVDLQTATKEKDALGMKLHQLELQKDEEELLNGPRIKKLQSQITELQDELDNQAARNSRLFNDKKKLEVELKSVQGDLEEEQGMRKKDQRAIRNLKKKIGFLAGEENGGASSEDMERLKTKNKELRAALDEEEDKNSALSSGKRRVQRELDENIELVQTLEKTVLDLREKVRRYRSEVAAKHMDDHSGDEDEDDNTDA